MKRIPKGPLIGLIVCVLMMFGWILLAVVLTGQREISDFTQTDKLVMIIFAVVEVITLVLAFVFANIVGKANRPEGQPVPQTIRGKRLQKRGLGIFIAAITLAIMTIIAGKVLAHVLPQGIVSIAPALFAVSAIIPILLLLGNILLGKLYAKRFENKSVREYQQFILSHRQDAGKTAAEKLRFLNRQRLLSDLYVAFLALPAIGVCLFGSMFTNVDWNTPVALYSFFLFISVISRLRFHTPQAFYDDVEGLASREDFPHIYALADKAAEALGCKGEIKLFFTDDTNAGIRNEHNYYCVFLGVNYLDLLSEQELYCILLHEFCHVDYQTRINVKQARYFEWLNQGGNPHYLSHLTRHLFSFGDTVYSLNYMLYDYAASISIETEADLAMAAHADAKAAASALIKLKYISLYNWEMGTYDSQSLYEPEEADKQYMTHRLQKLKQAIEQRQHDWNKLIDLEIISRSATHPTLKMRLESLGITDYHILQPEQCGSYALERQKAVEFIDEQVHRLWSESYEENRRETYITSLEQVTQWEAEGKPLVEEDYADICQALRRLGRNLEADQLCRQVIENFSGSVAVHAHFMRGCFLLHCYDDAGLEHIYTAMENNNNYIDEGLEVIGQFCCLTGNREELDCFREKALDIRQRQLDVYDEIGILRKSDQLSAEQLPEGMLERILTYIRSIDQDAIENIYLLKKTISNDFATSAFIIRFCKDTDDQVRYNVLHSIFNHLDACYSWQFSLFDYEDVADVKAEKIENSCVFNKE